jgi:hypothetical protein
MGEREVRARLEALQARVKEAKATLALPPQVDDEVAVLRAEVARLTERRNELRAQGAALSSAMREQEHAVRRVKEERRSSLSRALGRGGAGLVAGLGGGFVGGSLGALVLYGLSSGVGFGPASWVAMGTGTLVWTWILFRLGKAS